jgi:hypothetical protein
MGDDNQRRWVKKSKVEYLKFNVIEIFAELNSTKANSVLDVGSAFSEPARYVYYKSFRTWRGSYLFMANALQTHKEDNDS